MKKILLIRFSSIGDIVLTTPVIRAIKEQMPGAEVHFLTREVFSGIVADNPHLSKVWTFRYNLAEIKDTLLREKFDLIIDLHKNLRSWRLKMNLRQKVYSFDKLNLRKFLAVNLKLVSLLPDKHIVDRYFDGISPLNVKNDGKGLEYYISENDRVDVPALFFKNKPTRFIALVIGGSYFTKKIPLTKLQYICENASLPVVMLGGLSDKPIADELRKKFPHLINGSAQFSISQSASVISQAEWVITSDTGMMHIAAAFNKKIISVWGNTIPEFGMAPYLPRPENKILEVKNLACRPCSKLGYGRCPLGHFKCMNKIDFSLVKELN